MIVVLCDSEDATALWLVARLRAAGEQCALVTSDILSFARRRSQRIGRDGVHGVVELGDGTVIDAPALIVNRMLTPPVAAWRSAKPADRDYATAELIAFMMSWLAGVDCPVRNRPEPACLAGPAPHGLLAALEARRAGLACPDASFGDTGSPHPTLEAALRAAGAGARPVHAVVLDGRIVDPDGLVAQAGVALPIGLDDAVARFSTAIGADSALIGVDFVVGRDQWWFGGTTPLADLSVAGDAIVRELTRTGERMPA
jgi:hypothetical protein